MIEAQQPAKIAKIGELRNRPQVRTRSEVFLQALRELGYVEGKNVALEARYHESKPDRSPPWRSKCGFFFFFLSFFLSFFVCMDWICLIFPTPISRANRDSSLLHHCSDCSS